MEIELRVLHFCRLLLRGHSGFWVLPPVAALLGRHIWAFESFGVYSYNWGWWKLFPKSLAKHTCKFPLSDDGFFLSATAMLYSHFVDFVWCQHTFIPPLFLKYLYLTWLVTSDLSLPNYIQCSILLAYFNILVAAAAEVAFLYKNKHEVKLSLLPILTAQRMPKCIWDGLYSSLFLCSLGDLAV